MRPAMLLPCLLLLACANETAIPEATAPRPASAAVPSAPPRPVTAHDGRYLGPVSLNPDRTRECPRPPAVDREISVVQGRATFRLDPDRGVVQSGTIGPEGSIRMADPVDRTIATTGVFADGIFLGTYRNGFCSYAIRAVKRG